MNSKFNLLSLHYPEDLHPRTWIGIRGAGLGKTIRNLEKIVLIRHNLTREELSRNISAKYDCSKGVIKRILQGNSSHYPVPIILELLNRSGQKKFYLKRIGSQIEWLKVNSASSKPVIAVKSLSPTLAKIVGAFMADGSLSKSNYNVELIEEYQDSVLAFIDWFEKVFGVEPTNFHKKRGAYRVIFSNKIVVRYLMRFFDISPGPKAFTAQEPILIQKSSLNMRRAFAMGVLMFDGCVNKSGQISLCVKSEKLQQSIRNIWQKDRILFGTRKSSRGEWVIFSLNKNKKIKYFRYFEPETQKHKLLQWIGGTDSKPILKEEGFSISNLLKVIEENRSCDIEFLGKTFSRTHTTIKQYLRILKAHKKIGISRKPSSISEIVSQKTSVILSKNSHNLVFDSIRNQFVKDKLFSEILQVHKGTLSAWKRRKNGIPISSVLEMCRVLKINPAQILLYPFHVDRDIVEVI